MLSDWAVEYYLLSDRSVEFCLFCLLSVWSVEYYLLSDWSVEFYLFCLLSVWSVEVYLFGIRAYESVEFYESESSCEWLRA